MECNVEAIKARCACTYQGCPRQGRCCECLEHHLKSKQLPACAFPPEVERTYDRSFRRFVQVYAHATGG